MKTLSIALRNLLRNARRSIATMLGIAIGAIAILLFGGYKSNINYSMQTAYVRVGGHLQIQQRDYFLYGSGNPSAYGILNYEKIIAAIQGDPELKKMVSMVTPTLQFNGIAGNYSAGVSRTIIGNGIVAADQVKLRLWNPYELHLDTPELRLANSAVDAGMVGLGLARVLHLCEALKITDCPKQERQVESGGQNIPADVAALSSLESDSRPNPSAQTHDADPARKIELLTSNPRGAPNVVSLNVVHAESQGFKEFDEIYVVLHLKQAQKLVYGGQHPKVTSIIIQLRDTQMTEAAQARIESKLSHFLQDESLVIRDYAFLNPFYVQSTQMFDTIFGFMFVLIGGIVMFTVSNTMNTTVVERTIEIGTLRAIGLRRSGIRLMFVLEGALLGLSGALAGLLMALGAAAIINRLDLHWLPPGSASPVPLELSVWGETSMIVGTTCGLILMATLSAWWPAYRAARLNVVEALRHV